MDKNKQVSKRKKNQSSDRRAKYRRSESIGPHREPWGKAKHSAKSLRKTPESRPRLEDRTIERRTAAREGSTKQRGEISEAVFLAKASQMGFGVAKPWGDSEPYDFLLDAGGGNLVRVQVKSASVRCAATHGRGYRCQAYGCSATRPYTKDEVDFLVSYVFPEDAWYVFPIEAFEGIGSTVVYPTTTRRRSKYDKYRDAWCLMACKKACHQRRPRLRVAWKCGSSRRCVVK